MALQTVSDLTIVPVVPVAGIPPASDMKGHGMAQLCLYELAWSCYLFKHVVDFDISWNALQSATNGAVDIRNPAHGRALLKWLNAWGCRQFAKGRHDQAAAQIIAWFNDDESCLSTPDADILESDESTLAAIGPAFDRLSALTASVRSDGVKATVGPVGAAKILFALRPKLLGPWDTPIREHFGYDGSGASYVEHMRHIRSVLCDIQTEC